MFDGIIYVALIVLVCKLFGDFTRDPREYKDPTRSHHA